MARLVVLGTANAIPDPERENTHLALVGTNCAVLIDCVGTPTVHLARAGIPMASLTDLIVTHFHPDHVSGVPLLLMNMWLLGREEPLRVYGLHHCLERLEHMMALYHWDNWPDFFPVAFHRLPEREQILVLESEDFRVYSSPVRHIVPTIGLRVESTNGSRAVVYSGDTEPCSAVIRLANGADVLIHEASGGGVGHSTAAQAGEVARQAEVGHLVLIHYPGGERSAGLEAQAQAVFQGRVSLAQDFMEIELQPPAPESA
jgi:ribonuclease Z